MVLNFKPNVSR